MKPAEQREALDTAVQAARAAGRLMRKHLRVPKKINEQSQHDIKLELDVRSQKLIERILGRRFPRVAVLGEEGISGDAGAAARWVIDPIDGTVNFAYGIPHACVSIALQIRKRGGSGLVLAPDSDYDTVLGVVYDPFLDELWTALRGKPARLNGRIIRVSQRTHLREAIVAMGFAKYEITMKKMLPTFQALVPRVRKIRLLGAAALSMTWVATGRLDAYREYGVRLWDIAAGGLIVECAGGEFWREQLEGDHRYHILPNNGRLRKKIEKLSF